MVPEDAVPGPPATVAAPDIAVPADDVGEAAEPRPGWLVRFAAGAWHVPAGAVFLLSKPRLWGAAVLPAVLGVVAIAGGVVLGIYGLSRVDKIITPHHPNLPDVVDLIATLELWTATVAASVLGALAVVLVVCAPLLEWLELRTELTAGGRASVDAPAPAPGHALRAMRRALYLLAVVPLSFAIALVPFLGPPIAGILVAMALAFQLTAPALARRGLDFRAMREWHREWRAETLGFGVTALILLPLLSPILAPALATGAALLVYETHGEESEPLDKSTENAPDPTL